MTAGIKSALSLLVVAAVFVVATVMGVRFLTASAETQATAAATCSPRVVATGEDLTPNLVSVNVYNGSSTSGLANRVSINLQRNGFLPGDIGNVPAGYEARNNVTILAKQDSSLAKLVGLQFRGSVRYDDTTRVSTEGDGVDVVIGDDYKGLRSEKTGKIKAAQDTRVCVPTATAADQ